MIDSITGQATSYTVMINEYQRKRLQEALELVVGNDQDMGILDTQVGSGDATYDTERQEVHALLDMVRDLPTQEQTNPNILHGLCL